MCNKHIMLFITLLAIGLMLVPAQDMERVRQLEQEMKQLSLDFSAGKITAQQLQERFAAIQQELQQQGRQQQEAQQNLRSQGASYSQAQIQQIETILDNHKHLEAQFNEHRISGAAYTEQAEQNSRELRRIIEPFADSNAAALQYYEAEERVNRLWLGSVLGMPPEKGAFPNDDRDRSYLEVGDLSHPIRQAPNTRASYSPLRAGGAFGFIARYTVYQTGAGANQAALEDLRRQVESATGHSMERNTRGTGYYLEFIDNRSHNRDDNSRYYSTHFIDLRDGVLVYQVDDASYDELD